MDSNQQPLRYQRNALNHWAKSSFVAAAGFEPAYKAYETFELAITPNRNNLLAWWSR